MSFEKGCCPIVEVDGDINTGRQFDLEIMLPEDRRDAIYGVVLDSCKDPISDAVVKLIEITCEKGENLRKPVSHTFTDKEGQFVFGPLCPDRKYEIQVWVNKVKHCKVCARCEHDRKCLKGKDIDICDFNPKSCPKSCEPIIPCKDLCK